jgi:hypothetical protein
VKPPRNAISENQIEKIEGFAGLLRGKLAREHVLRLVRIIRRKREKLGAKKNILELSIYDCIADDGEAFGLYREEIDFCDKFIDQHVMFAKERTAWLSSSHSAMAG